jgi:FAD/FMN-containing dehydrogenase
VEDVRALIQNSPEFSASEKTTILPNGHGHVGDGNLHLNVVLPGYGDKNLQERVKRVIEPFVMDYVRKVSGSVSAEHGIGQQKPGFLHYSKSESMISTMGLIKTALDPNHILNPYKMLPTTQSGL